jgi:CDP-4-dehydro-6-deoxyglucose reductase
MMHHIHNHRLPHKDIYLIFGTRSQKDLLYYEELKQLAAAEPGFHFIPTLSREQWDGCCGYVHSAYESIIQQKKNGSEELPLVNFMLCGWKAMVDEAKERILKLGYTKKEIHLELYG